MDLFGIKARRDVNRLDRQLKLISNLASDLALDLTKQIARVNYWEDVSDPVLRDMIERTLMIAEIAEDVDWDLDD